MGTGLSSRSAPINMHYNLAQGVHRKGYPITPLKGPLKMSECLGWCNTVILAVQNTEHSSVGCLKTGGTSTLKYSLSVLSFLSSYTILFFFKEAKQLSLLFLTYSEMAVKTPTYWSQTHLYCIGYLYGNEGLHVSFYYFIFLCLLITTVQSCEHLLRI